jgi:hypothetical protein
MSKGTDMPQIQTSSQKYKFVIHAELARFFGCDGDAYIYVVAPNSHAADLINTFVSATGKDITELSLNELEQRLVKAVCCVARTSAEAVL